MIRIKPALWGDLKAPPVGPGRKITIRPTSIKPEIQPVKKVMAFDFALLVIIRIMTAMMGEGLAAIPNAMGNDWLMASRKGFIDFYILLRDLFQDKIFLF
jgi:hypothetical protein